MADYSFHNHSSMAGALFFPWIFMAIAISVQAANFNICDWIQCSNGGLCEPVEEAKPGFKCRCQFGFSGMMCEDKYNVTTCVTNPCANNGNCTITDTRVVKCICPSQFTGNRCEVTIGNRTQ